MIIKRISACVALSCCLMSVHAASVDNATQQLQVLNSQIQAQLEAMQATQQKQMKDLNTQIQNQLKQMQTTLDSKINTMNAQIQKQMQTMNDTVQKQIKQVHDEKMQAPMPAPVGVTGGVKPNTKS